MYFPNTFSVLIQNFQNYENVFLKDNFQNYKGVFLKYIFSIISQQFRKCFLKIHFLFFEFLKDKFILNSKFFKVSYQKTLLSVKFSKFLKLSLEKTFLESIFLAYIFHIIKTILNFKIFLNLYYFRNYLFILH